jgi:hypothetical protein
VERVFEWNVYIIELAAANVCSLVNVYFRKHVCYGACRFVEHVFEWNVYLSGTCIVGNVSLIGMCIRGNVCILGNVQQTCMLVNV